MKTLKIIGRVLVQLTAVTVVAFLGSLVGGAVQGNAPLGLAIGVATAALAVLTYIGVVRLTERRNPAELARKGAVGGLGRGLAIGVAMFAVVIGSIALLGGYRIEGLGSVWGAVMLVGLMAAAATTEELIFRGILFGIVEKYTGTWIALALTGLVFGMIHLINPHATLWGALAIGIEAGFMLAAAYAATRTLWVPIGLHFGWNFTESGIFGAHSSGTSGSQGLLDGVVSGPALIGGGEFGPEASLLAVLAGLLLTAGFMVLARRRGNLVPRPRRTTSRESVEAATATLVR